MKALMNRFIHPTSLNNSMNQIWLGIIVFCTLAILFPGVMGWVVAIPIIGYGLIALVVLIAALIYHSWKGNP